MPRTRSYGSRLGFQSGVFAYHYELVPWSWSAGPGVPHWRLPVQGVGGVDLRSVPQMAAAGGAPQGFAFAACRQSAGGTALETALHMNGVAATTAMRDAWQAATGYRPAGDTLTDLLADQLTTGSDPSGESGPKPLQPTVGNVLEIVVPGHSRVWSRQFRWGLDPHTGRLRDLLRRDFEAEWERSNGGDGCRRCLDYTCRKYRIDDWREFVPNRLHAHVPGRLPHRTTITEGFAGTGDGLGADLTWTEVAGDLDRSAGLAVYGATGTGSATARAEHDLSSDDHYAQCEVNAGGTGFNYLGAAARFAAAADTSYVAFYARAESTVQFFKRVTGTNTMLAESASITPSLPELYKTECDGSTLKGYQAGVERVSLTDSSISGNVRAGLHLFRSVEETVSVDDFEAADLAVAAGRRLPRRGGRRRTLLRM